MRRGAQNMVCSQSTQHSNDICTARTAPCHMLMPRKAISSSSCHPPAATMGPSVGFFVCPCCHKAQQGQLPGEAA